MHIACCGVAPHFGIIEHKRRCKPAADSKRYGKLGAYNGAVNLAQAGAETAIHNIIGESASLQKERINPAERCHRLRPVISAKDIILHKRGNCQSALLLSYLPDKRLICREALALGGLYYIVGRVGVVERFYKIVEAVVDRQNHHQHHTSQCYSYGADGGDYVNHIV